MNLTRFSMRNPHTLLAMVLVVAAMGLFAFFRTPTDLFPDSAPPQVAVITVFPGASSGDVADKITRIVEKELNTISGLKKVTSTSRDMVSSVSAEFYYTKPLGEALTDVQSVISRIRPDLPAGILDPRIYRITDATRPLLTLALSPAKGSSRTMEEIRFLAKNDLEDRLLNVPGVADVDIFGAHQPEVEVAVDRDQLAAHRLTLQAILAALSQQNISAPVGFVYNSKNEYLIRTVGEFQNLEAIRNLPVQQEGEGYVRIRDLATVRLTEVEPRSLYHGNGKPAIAINLMRPENGPTVRAIKAVKALLPVLRRDYPDIRFDITDDQQPIIDINIKGMRSSLVQAVVLTVLVILLFLADMRTALIISVSIPLAFLGSLVVLWFSPYTMNMVTLSGLIISVGMVVDASIVVLENIYRHYREMAQPNPKQAAQEGADEVSLAVTAGMFTTVIVLIPVMFCGGYTQQIMQPLNMMISSTLIFSLLVALTVIPLAASKLLRADEHHRNWLERLFGISDYFIRGLTAFYLFLLRGALRWRVLTLLLALVFLVGTMRNVPKLLGGELMPPMDTGVVILEFNTPSDYSIDRVEQTLSAVESMVYHHPGVEMVSSVVGSEPGQISFGGGGRTVQSARMVIHLVSRLERKETIWDIEEQWREQIRRIPGIRDSRISEYGATPLSTTKAPLDIIISGPEQAVISRIADTCMKKIQSIPGLVDLRRSWYVEKKEFKIVFDPELTRRYGLTPALATRELQAAVKGLPSGTMRIKDALDVPIILQYSGKKMKNPKDLESVYLPTRFGPIPLRSMAKLTSYRDQPFITRERLRNTIDLTGDNAVFTIAQVAGMAQKRLAKMKLPSGYSIRMSGTAANMKDGQREMGGALRIGIVLLYFLLLSMFKSFRHPLTIMLAIPLAVSGALWGLLIFNKPMCKPATMGLILLGGTIVNNSILMLDFILQARKRGASMDEAILDSVRLRIRPILMTTVSTIVGLAPLVFEMAVGLERMSPLGIVASTGLLIGTFFTMIIIPVFYSATESLLEGFQRAWRWLIMAAWC